jgi:hypothetical protein
MEEAERNVCENRFILNFTIISKEDNMPFIITVRGFIEL